jgi:hypothetical protein
MGRNIMKDTLKEVSKLNIAPKINANQVEEIAEKGADTDDIGRSLNLTPQEWKQLRLDRPELEEAMHRGRARLRITILSYQFEKAQLGDAKMLVWLGKQFLGQTEKTGKEKEAISFEREKEVVREAVKKDPDLIYKIFVKK